jgi:UDP-N-acetyl-alpha-D-muramoyl-L-alanyl-L-glutamate epimerase
MISDKNRQKYIELREAYKTFSFESFKYSYDTQNFNITFLFSLNGKYSFSPQISIPLRSFYRFEKLPVGLLENLIFHMGMVELISYWKAACPAKVIIKPYKLNLEQIRWWKKLYFNGLGEFFYLNGIDANPDDFMDIVCEGGQLPGIIDMETSNSYMVPIGGGKDSVVTLELLKNHFPVIPMVINPRRATDECITAAGFDKEETIIVHRSIDKQLLDLNAMGFLNGHTPFSAMLAFSSLLVAAFSGIRHIALSNEASANESTVAGSHINHQYSKSYEFEADFRYYVSNYITNSLNYFSFLRPLYEIQIAKLFAGFKQYHPVFKSCNGGSKTDVWCGNCPKCLFAYIILAPWLTQQELTDIFGENLLNKASLQLAFDQLTGWEEIKPFECIGTIEEINIALCAVVDRYGNELPRLLQKYIKTDGYRLYSGMGLSVFKDPVESEHFLSPEEMNLIKKNLYD